MGQLAEIDDEWQPSLIYASRPLPESPPRTGNDRFCNQSDPSKKFRGCFFKNESPYRQHCEVRDDVNQIEHAISYEPPPLQVDPIPSRIEDAALARRPRDQRDAASALVHPGLLQVFYFAVPHERDNSSRICNSARVFVVITVEIESSIRQAGLRDPATVEQQAAIRGHPNGNNL